MACEGRHGTMRPLALAQWLVGDSCHDEERRHARAAHLSGPLSSSLGPRSSAPGSRPPTPARPNCAMGLYKKHVPDRGLTWEQAVPEALCFGWIDSVSQRIDDDARRQRWTPRKASSNWSTVNIALVEQLTAEGRMRPAGIAAFERRGEDRSGVTAPTRMPRANCRPRPRHGWRRMPRHPRSSRRPRRPTVARSSTGCSPPSRRPRANGASCSSSRTARRAGWCPSIATGETPKWVERAAAAAVAGWRHPGAQPG